MTQKERDDKEAEKSKKVSENLQNLISVKERSVSTEVKPEEPGNVFDEAFRTETVQSGIFF